jgi:tetratricopeptide (TPR) repeat protein
VEGRHRTGEKMSLAIQKKFGRDFRPWGFCLILVAFALVPHARSQSAGPSGSVLAPPSSNLVPVHWPDPAQLEPEVREQLLSAQSALAAAVKDPATTPAILSEAYGATGEIYHAYSLVSAARECYLNANRLTPKDFRWIYLLGKLDQEEGHVNDALRHYQIAQNLRPEYVAVVVNQGNIYLELNRLEDAEKIFRAVLESDPSNASAHYGLGQVALSRRSYAEAAGHFEKALAQVPDANRIHYSLAMAYRGMGEAEKARAQLEQQGPVGVRVADPLMDGLQKLIKGERVHIVRGRLALAAQRYGEAAAEFRQALVTKPDSVSARLNLGAVLTQTGDLQGAAAQFEETLRIDPRNTIAHYNLAVLLANENKPAPAIIHLQSVLSADPNDLSARFLLGRQLLQSGRLEEAMVAFSTVVHADPDNEDALLEQVRLLQRKNQYQEALASLEKGYARHQQRGRTSVLLAYLLATSPQLDLRDGARALGLAQLVYKSTGSLNHGELIALALGELGRCDEAAAWLRQMAAKATGDGKPELVEKLKKELSKYERAPCRPPANLTIPDDLISP